MHHDFIKYLLYFIFLYRLLHASIFSFINSLCGYNNAAVFKAIELNDINYVEEYMRKKLAVRLENSNFHEKMHFFGNYANKPSEFAFNRGERTFVNQIINHIKEVAKSNDGLTRFKENVSDRNVLKFTEKFNHLVCQTSIGLAFCKLPSIIDKSYTSIGFNLQDDEHSADQKEFIDITELGFEFKIDSQLATDNPSDSAQRFENESKNFADNFCVQTNEVQNEQVSDADDEFSMLIENYRDALYTQIHEQNIRMKLCVSLHKEISKDFFVNVQKGKSSQSLVRICEIAKNGDCLFAAIAHQMCNVELNSLELKNSSDEMRKAVVKHILSNMSSFEHSIKLSSTAITEWNMGWH